MADALTVHRALAARGTRPALTWYGSDGRIELSGKVSANHLSKIAGYLTDELWLDPGAELELDLPAHWKQVLWGLGAMLAGLQVHLPGAEHPTSPAAVLTADPFAREGTADAVAALDLGPLALQWTGAPLPAGTFDASAEVLGAPDHLLDDSRHPSSNFAAWEDLGEFTEESERLVVALDRSPASAAAALASAAQQLTRGSLVVVQQGRIEDVARIEGARITQFVRNWGRL